MLEVTLVFLVVLASLAVTVMTVRGTRVVVPTNIEPIKPVDHQDALDLINARLDKMTLAVSDGIERVHRAESRIQKTVTSARRLVKENGLEHPGIDAEAAEIRERDENGIEPLPFVPEQVGATRTLRLPGGVIEW